MQGVLTLIQTDAGTENVEIHAIQVALRLEHRDSMSGYRSVSRGRSTSYVNPGSQISQVEVRKRCSRDLFTSSGRATALIDRHFWYTFLQQSMKGLTNTTVLLTYISHFHWRITGNWQEHICERNIRCFASLSHLSLGSDRLNVTVCRTCTVLLWDVQRTVGIWSYWKIILSMAGVTFIKFLSSLFHRRIWYNLLRRGGPNDSLTVQNIGKWQRVCSQHFVDGRPTPQHPHPTLFDYNNFKKSPGTPTARTPQSTHWGLVTPYSDKGLGQHWLRLWLVAWWHKAITWTNVNWEPGSDFKFGLPNVDVWVQGRSNSMADALGLL